VSSVFRRQTSLSRSELTRQLYLRNRPFHPLTNFPMKPIRFGKRLQKWVMSLLLPAFAFCGAPVQANPRGGVVVHGAADIAKMAGNQLRINQHSNAVIINWQDFSIAKGEVTRFVQPNNGTALNRVVTGNVSQIHGQLKGNANVYVINPNGIVIGANGVIDVGGNAVLSTLDIDDNDFLDGGPSRFYGDSSEGVTNFGTISSSGGDVVLMGGFVSNQGQIGALNGNVAIGAGGEILLQEGGSGSTISVRGSSDYTGTGIENSGSIRGASAELKSHGNVYALAINNTGAIRATGADRSNGRVRLTASGGSSNINLGQGSTIMARAGADGGTVAVEAGQGDVNVAGRIDAIGSNAGGAVSVVGNRVTQAETSVIDASGASRGGSVMVDAVETMTVDGVISANGSFGAGGEVVVTGQSVVINDNATISSDGATLGGRVRVGGDFQGRDTGLREADLLTVSSGARLSADSTAGNAGTVIAWANHDTVFFGDVSATASGPSGNGGLVEVSGKEYLYFDGSASVGSVGGKAGTVLFDPGDVIIGATGSETAPSPLSSPTVDSRVSIEAINQTLQSGANVLVVTESGNIVFESLGGGGDELGGTQANNRHSAVQWTNSQSSFGAFASGSIIVGNHIRTSGAGSINLIAGWSGGEGDSQLAFDPQTAWDFYVGGGDYGQGGGSVFIGTNAMTRHVEVGSRFGDTNIAGFDVTVAGSDTPANNRFAMIGFRDGGQVFAPRLNRGTDGGAIEIRLDMRVGAPGGTGAWYLSDGRNSTTLTPGLVNTNQPAAGVGDPIVAVAGQNEVDLNEDGIVDGVHGVNSTGVITDTFIPYANHFNSASSGNWWWQQIEATGSLETKDPLFLGGLRPEYGAGVGALSATAIGLGASSDGADINVLAKRNVLLQGGSGNASVGASIGHGGPNFGGGGQSHSTREVGNEVITSAAFSIAEIEANQMERRWSFNGSDNDRISTSIGRLAPVYGNINVLAGIGGGATVNHSTGKVTASVTGSGSVTLRATQTFDTVAATAATNAAAYIGHGGLGQFGEYYGDIHVEAGGDITLQAGEATRAMAAIGHTFLGHSYWNPTSEVDQQIRFFATAGDFDNPNLRRGELFSGRNTTGFDPTLDPERTRRYTLADYTITEVTPGDWQVILADGNTGNYQPLINAGTGVPTGQFVSIHNPANIIGMNPVLYSRGTSQGTAGSQGPLSLAPLNLAPNGPITVAALNGSVVSGLHGDIKAIARSGDISLFGYSTNGVSVSGARETRYAAIGHGGSLRGFAVATMGSGYQGILTTPAVPGAGGTAPDGRENVSYRMPDGTGLDTGSQSLIGGVVGESIDRHLTFMTITGDIEVEAGGNVTMAAGNDQFDYTRIGHGGNEIADYETSSFILGDIKVTAGGDVSVIGGGAVQPIVRNGNYELLAYSVIGHGGYLSGFFGFLGDIDVDAGGSVLIRNGAHSRSFAKIGHQATEDYGQSGGSFLRSEHFRDDGIQTDINVALTAAAASVTYAATLGQTQSPAGTRDFSSTGAGTLVGGTLNTANISVVSGGSVTLEHMKMGERQPVARDVIFNLNRTTPAVITANNPNNQAHGVRTNNSWAMIGHGGSTTNAFNVNNTATNYDDKIGDITVAANGGDITLKNGEGEQRWSRIGHGVGRDRTNINTLPLAYARSIDLVGNINVSASRNIVINADAADENERPENSNTVFGSAPSRWNPTVIGHGGIIDNLDVVVLGRGESVNGISASSNITALAGGSMSILGGKGTDASYAQLGHGFASDLGNDFSRRLGPNGIVPTGFAGNINVSVAGSIYMEGGANAWSETPSDFDGRGDSVTGAYAAIGHGGYQLDAPSFGDINVFAGYDLDMIAQRRTDPGTITPGNGYVVINPSVGSDAVSSAFNFVKIGHFAVENGNRQANLDDAVIDANQSGDIAVVVGRDLTMLGGTTPNVDTQTIYGAFSQIGHGGPAITGNLEGSITVLVKNDLAVIQGSEIGVGNITTTPLNNYAMIGHGDNLTGTTGSSNAVFRQVGRGFRNGDIAIAAGGSAAFNGAMVGHLDPLLSPQTTFGRLQVAVSRLNPFFGGSGALTAINETVFSSGGFGREQLEFYIPSRSNNLMDASTRINESVATFATAPANFAAPFNRDSGIYAGRADEVYLTPDLWWDQTGIAAIAGYSGAGVFPTDVLSGQGGALALVNEPGGLFNVESLIAGALGDSAPVYRDNNGVSGFGLYTIYYDAIEFVKNTFPTQPTDPTIPDPDIVFNFDGYPFTESFDSFMRDDNLLSDGYAGGDDSLYGILSLAEAQEDEEDDEKERERRKSGVGPLGLTYYIYEPGTNRYSSYRIFGIPAGSFAPLN
jgi:filamentous hemagglutinin family protein